MVFCIIVAYNGKQWYDRCFSSLGHSTIPIHTIVIDNASKDGTADYIKANYPEIHLIESQENLGFGKANNVALRYALDKGCDYVFLLNQDAWVEPDTIERLIDIHQRHPEYGILGPVQVNAEKTKVLDGVIQFLINPDNVNKSLFSDLIMGRVNEVYPVAEINAAAWLLPRKTLETVGGFDPLFLHYGEDWNYLSRVLYHGLKVGLTPQLKIVHDHKVRVSQPVGYSMTSEKWLLQRAADILFPDSHIDKLIGYYRKEALIKLLTLKKHAFKQNWGSYLFLKKNKNAIIASRVQNKQITANWL